MEYRIQQKAVGEYRPQQRETGSKWKPMKETQGVNIGKPVVRNTVRDAFHFIWWESGIGDDIKDPSSVKVVNSHGNEIRVAQRYNEKREEETDRYMSRELFVCDCEDISHQFVVTDLNDEDWPHISIEIKLNRNLGFWKRLGNAIRYVFGKGGSRFGDWDEILLNPNDAEKLQKVVDRLVAIRAREKETIIPVNAENPTKEQLEAAKAALVPEADNGVQNP